MPAPLRFVILTFTVGVILAGGCTRERPPQGGATPTGVAATLTPSPATTPVGAIPTLAIAATPTVIILQSGGTLDPAAGLPPTPNAPDITPQPTAVAGSAAAGESFTYKVQPGDTLYGIARKFGVEAQAILDRNQLPNPNALSVGQEIVVPGQAPAGAQTGEGYIHVVAAGETLFAISQQYGVPLDQLAQVNQITNPNALRVGQRLLIPTGAQQTPATGAQRLHIVQPGETLTSIAARYGVSPQAIMAANALQNPNRIVSGQRLIIP
jgi:LysM repeat protein